jgi:hypothetical protein
MINSCFIARKLLKTLSFQTKVKRTKNDLLEAGHTKMSGMKFLTNSYALNLRKGYDKSESYIKIKS